MSADREGWDFSFVDRVRFSDVDSMDHLNNATFLSFFESARIAYMQSIVENHDPTTVGDGVGLIFAEAHINYRAPAYFDEEIRTFIRPRNLRRSSFRTEFLMVSERDGRTIADGWGALVGYDYGAQKAAPVPERLVVPLKAAGAEAPMAAG
ncbi:MAG: acyl-CoA thioesterase [Solirubrobacteraceae bacterium]|nr:acyl-CoA thioesterase [Solirubrobacteraceae bacterium]